MKRVSFHPILAICGAGLLSLSGLLGLHGFNPLAPDMTPIATGPSTTSDEAFAPATAKPRPKTTAGGGSRMIPSTQPHSSSAFF